MSETPAEVTATETDTTEPAEQVKPTETVEFWKAKAREQERRAKENAAAAQRLKEVEDSSKSEAEKVAERATTAEQRATESEGRALRLEVILERLPDGATVDDVRRLVGLSKRLVGSTREELEADAVDLLTTFKVTPQQPARPAGDIGQGPRPAARPLTDGSPRSLIAAGIASSDAAKK